MHATALMTRIRKFFPRVEESDYDFTIPLGECRAQFVCGNIGNLDFRIIPSATDSLQHTSSESAVTAIELLVRSTDMLWPGIRKSLTTKHFWKRPILTECRIEDTQSKFTLLIRDTASPLRSPGAKVAWVISLLFAIAIMALVVWQLHASEPSNIRSTNILTIALALGTAALSAHIPIFINWRDWKKSLQWRYTRVGQR